MKQNEIKGMLLRFYHWLEVTEMKRNDPELMVDFYMNNYSIPIELPVILQITKIIDALADEYSNEQKLAYMGNDQKIIRENDIKINTLMELKRVIGKSNLSK